MASMRSMRLHLGLWLLAAAARCESNHSVIVVAGFVLSLSISVCAVSCNWMPPGLQMGAFGTQHC